MYFLWSFSLAFVSLSRSTRLRLCTVFKFVMPCNVRGYVLCITDIHVGIHVGILMWYTDRIICRAQPLELATSCPPCLYSLPVSQFVSSYYVPYFLVFSTFLIPTISLFGLSNQAAVTCSLVAAVTKTTMRRKCWINPRSMMPLLHCDFSQRLLLSIHPFRAPFAKLIPHYGIQRTRSLRSTGMTRRVVKSFGIHHRSRSVSSATDVLLQPDTCYYVGPTFPR